MQLATPERHVQVSWHLSDVNSFIPSLAPPPSKVHIYKTLCEV